MSHLADPEPLSRAELSRRADDAFRADRLAPPPLTLRGGVALDDYEMPPPFDPALDDPTDAYLERHAFWGLAYLDGASWRHYLPRLIAYTFEHPGDPAMVVEAAIRSMRPPDRYPPRLAALDAPQEDVVRRFLEMLAFDDGFQSHRDEARQALEEWWWPNPTSRPTAAQLEAERARPTMYRQGAGDGYRLEVPETLSTSNERDIPSERRRVQTWNGYACGDVPMMVTVNRLIAPDRTVMELAESYARHFSMKTAPAASSVTGAGDAVRVEGETPVEGPGSPQRIVIVVARSRDAFVLTIRAHDRPDVRAVAEHIESSFAISVSRQLE